MPRGSRSTITRAARSSSRTSRGWSAAPNPPRRSSSRRCERSGWSVRGAAATLGAPMGLLRPVVSRLVALVPVVLGVSILVFALNAVALGDPARAAMGQRADPEALERLRHEYALDRPLPAQYARWIGRLMRGDLGRSFREQRPVLDVLAERAPATIRLALAATVISIVLGVGIGGLAAVRPGSALDH